MLKKISLLLSLLLITRMVVADELSPWSASLIGSNLSSAGTNDYAQQLNPVNAENPIANYVASPQLGFSIIYSQPTRSIELSAFKYITRWQTNTIDDPAFIGPYYYDGYQSLDEISMMTNSIIMVSDQTRFIVHTGAVYDLLRTVTQLTGSPASQPSNYLGYGSTEFKGIGPKLGMSLVRDMSSGFSFTNRIDLGLSYGKLSSSSLQADHVTDYYTPAHTVLVPNIDVLISLNYDHVIQQHRWSANLGLQYQTFLNVSNDHNNPNNDYQNVSFYGPFLKVAYRF